MKNPDQFSPDRAAKLDRWQRNRDHTNGSDAVKSAGIRYLPRRREMSDADYTAHVAATNYLPAAARTLQSHLGLVFRKPSRLTAPSALVSMTTAVTEDGKSLEQLARWSFREYLATNDGGLLIDHPEAADGMTVAQRLALDLRPYIARYSAEAIRGLTYGVVGGRKRLINVRLSEAADRVRELTLDGGVYTVITWMRTDAGEWIVTDTSQPKANGQVLDFIPFVPLGDEDEEGAAFDDLVSANCEHYLQAGKHEQAMLWLSRPKPWVAGVANDVELDVSPGSIWRFETTDVQVGMLQLDASGLSHITDHLAELKEQMAQLGSRMLASEKAAAEAAETVARRQASENSVLASMARHTGDRITEAVKILGRWLGVDVSTVAFALNTDFIPAPIDPQTIAQLVSLNQAGKLTDRELFDALQKGEIIDESVDFEAHQAELDATQIDPPIGD